MKNDIKAILKDFYRSKPAETDVHCRLIGQCVPDVPVSYVDAVLKEFVAGEYTLLDASAEKILSYKPEPRKKDKITG